MGDIFDVPRPRHDHRIGQGVRAHFTGENNAWSQYASESWCEDQRLIAGTAHGLAARGRRAAVAPVQERLSLVDVPKAA
jgi:hypothetical protein